MNYFAIAQDGPIAAFTNLHRKLIMGSSEFIADKIGIINVLIPRMNVSLSSTVLLSLPYMVNRHSWMISMFIIAVDILLEIFQSGLE
jgi:hypothetical protein